MKAVRRTTVFAGSILFAVIWTSLVSVSLAPAANLVPDDLVPSSVPLLLILLAAIFCMIVGGFVRAHWSFGWPLGGFVHIPGSRAWTIGFVGGALIVFLCSVVPPSLSEPESIGIIGAADGPTTIYVRNGYSASFGWMYSVVVGLSALVVIGVAARNRRIESGEPGATDNPGCAQ